MHVDIYPSSLYFLVYTTLMKLFYIFLGLAIFSLAGVSFYYTNIKKEETEFKVATSTPQKELIYIYREYGDVSFKNKTASSFTAVTDSKVTIGNYATVKTGDGRGYVIFPDNSSITLSSSTEIEISYEPTKVSIMQLIGSTYHRVTSLATGNKYEVRTPNTLAAVRGTKLAVTYIPKTKKTFVAVTEHSVEVTPTKDDGTPSKAPVMVQEGSLADIQSSTSTKVATTTEQNDRKMVIRGNAEVKEIKVFIDENKIIDKEYDKTPLEGRKEFLEKVINSLQQENKANDRETDESAGTAPTKTESRTEILNRAVKQVTSTIKPTPTVPNQETGIPPKTSTETPAPTKTEPVAPVVTETRTLKTLPINAEEFTPEQEAFIDAFYTVYERYFLVDDAATYCRKVSTLSSKDIIMSLLAVTNKAGYTLPKQTELSAFANDLVTSCTDGSMKDKVAGFKTRFDIAYPY